MTRLKTNDISNISSRLEEYNQQLLAGTGRSLLGIACHAYGKDEVQIRHRIESFSIVAVPVTAGQGIITQFSETVTAILQFLGFNAMVSDKTDTSGVALAFDNKADAIMLADDHRFVGLNLKTRAVADNSEATGRVFASVLDLMAKGIKGCEVLVLGCGAVGEAAAGTLLSLGARVALYDIDLSAARLVKERLSVTNIVIETNMHTALLNHKYVLEATPGADIIPDRLIRDHMVIAAPGVPLGISKKGCQILKGRLIHDKLELGVAGMAISLVL